MRFNSYAEQKSTVEGISIVSCGHIFAEPKREINRPNGRDDWLLFYVAKESETFYLEKKTVAKAGAFIVFAPYEAQKHVYEGDKRAEFYYVHFRCKSLFKDINIKTSTVYQLDTNAQFISLFEKIIEETQQKNAHYETLSLAYLITLFTLMQREITQSRQAQNLQYKSISFALQHINKFCDADLKLEDYAQMCSMSKYHFLRVFKQIVGETPLAYRNRIRIEHAKELLKNGYLSVSEISQTLGFSSPSFFSDAFKTAVGLSPAQYKKQINSSKTQVEESIEN